MAYFRGFLEGNQGFWTAYFLDIFAKIGLLFDKFL